MIALPFNDLMCLGSITEQIAERVKERDAELVAIAEQHPTVDSLAAWIRRLPQRDDEGERDDGPKVAECKPEQRLRVPAPDPNCVVMQSGPLCGAGNKPRRSMREQLHII